MTTTITRMPHNRARLKKVQNGAAASSKAVVISASADIAWLNGLSLAATFDGEFSDTTRSYAGKGVVRYAW